MTSTKSLCRVCVTAVEKLSTPRQKIKKEKTLRELVERAGKAKGCSPRRPIGLYCLQQCLCVCFGLRVGNRTSDAHYNRTPLLGICVRHLSDNVTGLKDRYHSRWVSVFIGVPLLLSFLYSVEDQSRTLLYSDDNTYTRTGTSTC